MKFRISIFMWLMVAGIAQAQDKTALQYAEKLDSARMRTTLTRLTSKEFGGRKSSEKGGKLTADYLAEQLKKNGIKEGNNGSYKQNISAFKKENSNKRFNLANFNYSENYSYSNGAFQDSVIAGSDIVFAGYGIFHSTFNDFANIDIKGKIVVILDGDRDGPTNKFGVRYHGASEIPSRKYIAEQKPKAVLFVKEGFSTFYNYSSDYLNFFSPEENQSFVTVQVNELLANRILEPVNKTVKQLKYEAETDSKLTSFEFKNPISFNGDKTYKLADVNNVVAIIEGSDLKNEYVVLSAHYDHIGEGYRGEIHPGADDNASGVSAVMEIARVLTEAKKAGKGPRRSVVILFPTAEEDGLYGSRYYVEKPIYPLAKTVACVNIDMIGRTGSGVDKDIAKSGYIYALTGTSRINDTLFSIPDSINLISTKLSVLSMDGSSYSDFYSRSDHYIFYKKNIPSIMFTNGTHEDLHRTTDAAEKIDFDAMQKRSKLVFLTLWELANNPKPFHPKRLYEEAVINEYIMETVR